MKLKSNTQESLVCITGCALPLPSEDDLEPIKIDTPCLPQMTRLAELASSTANHPPSFDTSWLHHYLEVCQQ
jgi:hypothetical protein